jgi:hypothetical protein
MVDVNTVDVEERLRLGGLVRFRLAGLELSSSDPPSSLLSADSITGGSEFAACCTSIDNSETSLVPLDVVRVDEGFLAATIDDPIVLVYTSGYIISSIDVFRNRSDVPYQKCTR